MSTHIPNKDNICWANCPVDVLLIICRKLDLKSLINSMFINKHWQDVIEYYCQHFNMWERMVVQGMNDTGLAFREKSTLNYREIIFRDQQWYNVKTAAICLQYYLTLDSIRSISVYKDNLVVLTNKAMNYYNIENFKLVKMLDNTSCISHDETSSLSAELRLLTHCGSNKTALSLVNKLHNKDCDCFQDAEYLLQDVTFYKVHFDCCYTLDTKNGLRLNRAVKCRWESKFLARYYGSDPICGLHVCEQDVYVLLKRGDILRVDLDCRKLDKLFQLDFPISYLDTKPFMFHTFSVLCPVSPEKEFEILPQKQKDVIIVACPRLTCLTEHGRVLLVGYEDGKIEIFLTDNLLQNITTPELRFNLQSFKNTVPIKIFALDIYEGSSAHHLVVATDCNIYKFLISDM